jgi:Flp pilus assembly protein TadG
MDPLSDSVSVQRKEGRRVRHRKRQKGQVLALFALTLVVIVGMVAVVVDISWFWANALRVQRAADAAALAGAIYLPGDPTTAYAVARAEAAKNGYVGDATTTITPTRDTRNPRRLNVTITASAQTFFARIFGMQRASITQSARAEYTLPVPMGSPLSYIGIYQLTYKQSNGTWRTDSVAKAPGASGAATLTSQGFWSAVLTRGGQRENGDAYSPQNNGGSANALYDPAGYDMTIEMPAGTNGRVYLFDATFCAVGHHDSGSYLGTGDHWIGTGGRPVTTQFTLWNTRNTLFDTRDDVQVADSGNQFANENQVDKSTAYLGDGKYGDDGFTGATSADCRNDADHNKWYRLAQNLSAGTYRLQVTTSSAGNISTNAENMFGVQAVVTGGTPRIHGTTRMAMYNNLNGGASLFYLAQIDAVHAGKTVEIRLFDPGDVGGDAVLRLKRPTTTGYVDATFSYTADNGRSGTNVTSIQTASGGTNLFNNSWITIQVPLSNTYGLAGDTLLPPGETQPGWWKVQYTITAAGNDTTTWEVSIRGNPVHLVTP